MSPGVNVGDWADHAVTGLLSASFVAALFGGYLKLVNARHKNSREVRGDEIDVLRESLDFLRKERDKAAKRLDEREADWAQKWTVQDKELRDLKDNYTACLLRCGRTKARLEVLERQMGIEPEADEEPSPS